MNKKTSLTEDRVREIVREDADKAKKELSKTLGDILRIGFNLPVKKTKHT
jgi:hypothetical protein